MRLLPCLFAALVSTLSAAEEPAAFVVASRSGAHFFKMVPGAAESPASGAAYAVQGDGSFKEIWRTGGWYARQVYLSDDGRTLVRLSPQHPGRAPTKTDLALAFYHDGELVREYHTGDLVKDPKQTKFGREGYDWLAPVWVTVTDSRRPDGTARVERDAEAEPQLDAAGIFRVKTIDRIVYHFEAATGKLVKRKLP